MLLKKTIRKASAARIGEKEFIITKKHISYYGITFTNSARITLESGKPALLTFLSPEEAEGISLYADGCVAYIGNGVRIPFSEKGSDAALGLLRVVSSLPKNVKTVIRTEFNGEKVYRCETADGAVFVTEDGKPAGFSSGGLTAIVTG